MSRRRSLCRLQMHIVHFNSDKYANVSMAVDKSDGLAVLGVLVEVNTVPPARTMNTFHMAAIPNYRDTKWLW